MKSQASPTDPQSRRDPAIKDSTPIAAEELRAGTDKYLTFALGREEYGVGITKVLEIIGMMNITPLPRAPDFIRGVINIRGRIVPVADLGRKLGLPASTQTALTCIILLRLEHMDIGIMADRVIDVVDIPAGSIQAAPSFGSTVKTDFIRGLAQSDDAVTILMDVDQIFATVDFIPAPQAGAAEEPSWCPPLNLAIR